MPIGSGIFLIVVGGILAFAVNVKTSAVDPDVVGYICIAAARKRSYRSGERLDILGARRTAPRQG